LFIISITLLKSLVFVMNLTFICHCIASISLKYNQQDATLSQSIYFYKLLYMFQAVPPPIIRSTKLYIRRQVLSNVRLQLHTQASSISTTTAAGSSIGLTIPEVVCTVLCSWWWAEEPPETFPINQPTRCDNFSSLLLDVYSYVQLSMFRVSSRP